jgi:dimethylargininase
MKVLVRPPSDSFSAALSEHPARQSIDPAAARVEHAGFVAALRATGADLHELPPEPALPDACFVSDTMLALPAAGDPGGRSALLVATRPGAPSRRPEVASVMANAYSLVPPTCEQRSIKPPATLDGGDVIVYGDRVAVGVSARTTREGAEQLADAVRGVGYRPFLCPVSGRLHLASWVTVVRDDLLVGTAGGYASLDAVGAAPEPEIARILVPDDEVPAANVLPLAGRCFMAAGFPVTAAALRTAGEDVVELLLDQFTLADGGPTCLVAPIH